ncbi:MAG: hypothetical protein FWC34_10860 [Bacteroidetes bacterium]|nr:hypothetical protein [Bacteroidota bacterium]MCL2302722.1 hypothetical protein [Lentimicrobiaceae bacterium]
MKKLFILSILLTFTFTLSAQNVFISGIKAEVQGTKIAVHFKLNTDRSADLELYYSMDDGRTWLPCKTITGNIEAQTSGNKTIIWDCLQDGILQGDLVFNVKGIQKNAPISQNKPINVNPNMSFSEFKAQLRMERKEMRHEKKSIPNMLLGNPLAINSYKRYRNETMAGWSLFGGGIAMVIVGANLDELNEDVGLVLLSIGSAAFISGIGVLIASSYRLKTTYSFYLRGARSAASFNIQPLIAPNYQGVGMSLRF